jgi:GLPGLI family protein
MRKNVTLSLLIPAFFMLFTLQAAGKDFTGVITYKITLQGSGITDEMKTMMPKTMIMTIKGNKSHTEMVMGMGKTVSIANADDKSSITLIDMMGQKIAIQSTYEDIMEEMDKSPELDVKVTGETKTICGYVCKKAIITHPDEDIEIFVYFTEELGSKDLNFDNPQFKDINGVMLEFEMPNEQFTMQFIATSVEKKKVDDSMFTIPDGYQIKTKDEMRGMFGGF